MTRPFSAISRLRTARLSWSSCRYRLRNLNTVALGNGFKSSIVLRPSVYLSSRLSALVGAAYSEKQKKTEWANPKQLGREAMCTYCDLVKNHARACAVPLSRMPAWHLHHGGRPSAEYAAQLRARALRKIKERAAQKNKRSEDRASAAVRASYGQVSDQPQTSRASRGISR